MCRLGSKITYLLSFMSRKSWVASGTKWVCTPVTSAFTTNPVLRLHLLKDTSNLWPLSLILILFLIVNQLVLCLCQMFYLPLLSQNLSEDLEYDIVWNAMWCYISHIETNNAKHSTWKWLNVLLTVSTGLIITSHGV